MIVKNTARDYMRALTCGLSQECRDRRIVVMLRAFVDEGGSPDADGIFVMAGLVAFVHHWEQLSADWEAALRDYPPVPFFKTSDFRNIKWRKAHNLSESEAKVKALRLASMIQYPPLLFSVCTSVNKAEYRAVVRDGGILKKPIGRLGKLWIKTPYNFCFHNIISMTLRKIVDDLGICGDVGDFVFDRNEPHFDAANEMLRGLRSGVLNSTKWHSTLEMLLRETMNC